MNKQLVWCIPRFFTYVEFERMQACGFSPQLVMQYACDNLQPQMVVILSHIKENDVERVDWSEISRVCTMVMR
jgi:hypothetical protein